MGLGAACRLTQLREHLADGILPNWRKERMIFNKSLHLPTFLVGLEEFLIGGLCNVQIELGLVRRAPHWEKKLLMVREETTVQDVHLVALLHLHPDPVLVGCQCILFGHQNIPVLVLHAQLEEKPGAEHAKTGFTFQNGALRFDYYLAPSVP